jgi:hypothetical protein
VSRAWVVLLAGAALAVPVARAAPPDAQALRAEATKLFKKKKYAAACEKFGQAAAATPDDADLLTDLALCQHKLGQDKEAIATNLRAIELASRDGKSIDDPAAVRVRRHAYFNLDQANGVASGGVAANDQGTKCNAVQPAPGCAQSFHVCGFEGAMGFRMREYSRTLAKIALTPTEAAWKPGETDKHAFDDPLNNPPSHTPPDKPETVDDGNLLFVANFEDEARTAGCDQVSGWTCEWSGAVQAAAEACLKAAGAGGAGGGGGAGGSGGAKVSLEDTGCFKKVCAELDAHPSKAVAREKRQAEKKVNQCSHDLQQGIGAKYWCTIVYANACNGLLALSCTGTGPGTDETSHIDEYHFVAPAP